MKKQDSNQLELAVKFGISYKWWTEMFLLNIQGQILMLNIIELFGS